MVVQWCPCSREDLGKATATTPVNGYQFWGRHLWARGYFCCSSGNVTDEVVAEYIANQGRPGPGDFRVEEGEL